MATATAETPLRKEDRIEAGSEKSPGFSPLPRLGVRARQIALITLLVALVVMVTTVINIAHLTGVIINRTEEEARQVSEQIRYAINQELSHDSTVDDFNPLAAVASEHSGVRGLMESTIISSRTIAYMYLTNLSGGIITDSGGRNELAANRYLIGDLSTSRPDFGSLTGESAYIQLGRMLVGAPIYEFRERLEPIGGLESELHVGISSAGVRRELFSPIATNLIIGLLAIFGAAIVAISSANLLLRPLEVIQKGIDQLGLEGEPARINEGDLPRDEMVTGVATRLRQIGERLAGERSELAIMRGRLRQVISHLEERLLLINREGRVILARPDA